MKAAVLYGKGDLRICDFPEPPMKPDYVKVAVKYCGICGTDLHKFAGRAGSRPVVYPVPLGHEISGVVESVGPDVTDFRPGDRVTVDPNWSCGKCWYCRNNRPHLCDSSRGVVKGMAEYVCAPVKNVYHLPDGLSLRDAALTEPLSCVVHGLDQLGAEMGDTVAVIGMGAIGAMVLQLLRRVTGVDVVVIDALEEKRELSLAAGAKYFINSVTEDVPARLNELGVKHLTRVIECVGIPVTAELALKIADRGATVVIFGVNAPEAEAKFNLYDMFSKELTVKTSYINPRATQRAIDLLACGAVDAGALISAEISLNDFPAEIVSREHIKHGKVIVRIE